MQIIDGKATAAQIKQEIAEEVGRMVQAGRKRPHLAAVLVGHDGGSETYVHNKVLACEACGFRSTLVRYEDDVTEAELLACVDRLNNDADIDGFIVQLPLPRHITKHESEGIYQFDFIGAGNEAHLEQGRNVVKVGGPTYFQKAGDLIFTIKNENGQGGIAAYRRQSQPLIFVGES